MDIIGACSASHVSKFATRAIKTVPPGRRPPKRPRRRQGEGEASGGGETHRGGRSLEVEAIPRCGKSQGPRSPNQRIKTDWRVIAATGDLQPPTGALRHRFQTTGKTPSATARFTRLSLSPGRSLPSALRSPPGHFEGMAELLTPADSRAPPDHTGQKISLAWRKSSIPLQSVQDGPIRKLYKLYQFITNIPY